MRWGAKCKDSESEAPTKKDPSSSSSTINTDSRSHGGSSSSSDSATDYLIRPSRVSAIKSNFVVVIAGGIRLMSAPTGKRKICAKGPQEAPQTQNRPLGRHTAASAAGDRRVHFKISFQKLRRRVYFEYKEQSRGLKRALVIGYTNKREHLRESCL